MPDRLATLTGRLREVVPRPSGSGSGRSNRSGGTTTALTWTTLVLVAAGTGVAVAVSGEIGLAVAGFFLVFGIFVADPILLAVAAFPLQIVLVRVGGASTNLSTADFVVFIAGLACLFQIRWRDAHYLKQFMQGIVWFEAVLLLVVVVNPNRYDVIEWFHRWSYLGASTLVGWVIASSGRVRPAFRAFLYAAAALGAVAMVVALATHFQPAQFGLYQKNAIGALMWVAVAVAQINPPWLGLGRREVKVCKYLCFGGLLASYSRQAVIVLILALIIAVLRNPDVRRRSKLMLLGAIPLVVALYYSFALAARSNPQFNSVSIRVNQLDAALHVWHLSPLFGEGMRFYNLPQFSTVTAPPNVLIDNLASTGIVGSLVFFYLVFITTRTMFRLPAAVGTLGLAILVAHYVDGLFDTFWIGALSTVPFIICGVCLGMADSERARAELEGGHTAGEPEWRAAQPVRQPVRTRTSSLGLPPGLAVRVEGLLARLPGTPSRPVAAAPG
jgi:polysaccharide biosynthesis protein PslJ